MALDPSNISNLEQLASKGLSYQEYQFIQYGTFTIADDSMKNISTDAQTPLSNGTFPPAVIRIEHQLFLYGLPMIVAAGTLGNAASAVILSRPRMRSKSVYFYLLLLSAVDTVVLYSSGVKTWLRLTTGIEWLHVSDMACRCLTFTFIAALHLSAWLVVLTLSLIHI